MLSAAFLKLVEDTINDVNTLTLLYQRLNYPFIGGWNWKAKSTQSSLTKLKMWSIFRSMQKHASASSEDAEANFSVSKKSLIGVDKSRKFYLKNSRVLMGCTQLFCARNQILQSQLILLGSFSFFINEIMMYRGAIFNYKLKILRKGIIMVNKLIPMALVPRSGLKKLYKN